MAMAAVAVIGLGISMVSQAKQAKAYKKAGDRAEALAAENALFSKRETEQAVKSMEKQQNYQQALAKARIAASGITGRTPDLYLEDMKTAGLEEVSWLEEVGVTRYRQEIAAGESAKAQAVAGMWGSIGNAATTAVQAYSTYQTNYGSA